MKPRYAFQIGTYKGAPVWLGPSFFVGALVFGGGSLAGAGAYLFLVLAHELGHAVLVSRAGLAVRAVSLHFGGGECWHDDTPSAMARAKIAWGGVLAQALVLVTAVLAYALFPNVASDLTAGRVLFVLTFSNAAMIAWNLLPIEPYDGARAWQLPVLYARRWARQASAVRAEDEGAAFRRKLEQARREAKRYSVRRQVDLDGPPSSS